MRFPSQLLLTGAVLGAFTASAGTALTLTAGTPPAPQVGAAVADSRDPAPSAPVPDPLIDRSQIAGRAVEPTRDPAADLAEERHHAQPRPDASGSGGSAGQDGSAGQAGSAGPGGSSESSGSSRGLNEHDWQRLPPSLRAMVREACASGRLTGAHCEQA